MRGVRRGSGLLVLEARCASNESTAASVVAGWIGRSPRALLALDAPLGWPAALGRELAGHEAGRSFAADAHTMFGRLTDDEIHRRLRRRPLEVAADRIARAAHAALRFLGDLRALLDHPVPLVWTPQWRGRFGAIEIYPAATRIAFGVPGGPGSLAGLEDRVQYQTAEPPDSEHARDAIVCGLAAIEFLEDRAVAPTRKQLRQARKEGWIWSGAAPRLIDDRDGADP